MPYLDCIISAIVGALVGSGITYAITVNVNSKRSASGKGSITEQSKISAGGDVAGRDITKNK
jgi:hypothetical protein